MEVDERLRWLESRVSSSLHPKGEELRSLFSDSNNRSAFLDFCNNSEVRHLFVHLPSETTGSLRVSTQPPTTFTDKALFFLKSNNASRLNKETISEEVACSECSPNPVDHLELVIREVYLPILADHSGLGHGISTERILDILHRMMSTIQVTQGYQHGDFVLPIPSLDVLTEGALTGSTERRAIVIHIMETCVVSWMKQVKMAIHFDPNGAIVKEDGKMAGPMAEIKYWEHRLQQLVFVREQLNSGEVLHILSGLEHARSTYANAFIDVHRDISKTIIDTELVLVYVNAIKPWFQKLHVAFSPDTLLKLFPCLVVILSLVWQHSGLYSLTPHFHRLLRLVSNELSLKARDIIGDYPLSDPAEACINIRLALRVCSGFRGYYLDRKEWAEGILAHHKEQIKQLQQESLHNVDSTESTLQLGSAQVLPSTRGTVTGSNTSIYRDSQANRFISSPQLCSWPARNASVFTSLNMTMERCNDLLELVQTMEHFSELAAVADQGSSDGQDPILTDIYHQFLDTLEKFKNSTKDLMNLELNGFEKSFFEFRSTVKELEAQLSAALLVYFEESPSLEATLRLVESFQGLISRDSAQSVLRPKLDSIIDTIQSEIDTIRQSLLSYVSRPPTIPNTPPTSSKLLWLHALWQRVDIPMERVHGAAPYLLQGEKGFTLRHTHAELHKEIEKQRNAVISSWMKTVPQDIETALQQTLLTRSESGELQVNFNFTLEEILREMHYLNGPTLAIPLPAILSSLRVHLSLQTLHEHKVGLEVCVRHYNTLHQSLDSVHKGLFQHKLVLLDNLLIEGVQELNWLSLAVPDFLAKFKATIKGDLLPVVEHVLQQSETINQMTQSWTSLTSLDLFSDLKRSSLQQLQESHFCLIESLERQLSTSMSQIQSIIEESFKFVEVSWESPAWSDYLGYLDNMILSGLKQMMLHSMNTLTMRAQKYEQGGSIPPMVVVSLELHEKEIQFSPPLSPHSSQNTVPEVIRQLLENFLSVSKIPQRLAHTDKSYFEELSHDTEVRSNIQKIIAHVETSARQCQSLRKRFSQYAFLWEQDVLATFDDFLKGVAQPHPQRFTRPETVTRSRSATHSARPKSSHSAVVPICTSQTASSVLESVTGISDWEFLKPNKDLSSGLPATSTSDVMTTKGGTNGKKVPKNPTLDDFDGEIAVFQGILERLTNSLDNVDVGWVCVDQCAVKSALSSLATKWTHVYAHYLENKVLNVLKELEKFFNDIEPQVEDISGEDMDPSHIMTLVSILNKVNLQQLVMDGKFGAVHRAVAILDKFHQHLPSRAKDQFEAVPQRWSSLKKRLVLSKQRIAPFIQSHSTSITHDLKQFGDEATQQRQSFLASLCLSSRCDPSLAIALIREYCQKLLELQVQAKDLMELQELLQSAVVNFGLLKQFEEELTTAHQLWEIQEFVTEYHQTIQTQVWLTVDIEEMRESCDTHMTSITSLVSCSVEWDIRIQLEKAIKEMQLTVPLLEGLSSDNMRLRHWKQVLRYSTNHLVLATLTRNGTIDLNVLKQLTLGRFMELKLTDYSAEILVVVERACKEVAIEELLKNLEEVWLSMQFQLKPYIRLHGHEQVHEAVSDIGMEGVHVSSSTPHSRPSSVRRKSVSSGHVSVVTPNITDKHTGKVMLLDDVEKIFEALDHYQTSLQSLESSVGTTSFLDDLSYWHKQLQTVEAVLRVWCQVQTLWVQFEEVMTSGEAAQHLPTPHFNFTTMDKEWRELMKTTSKSPNVLSTCLQEDLLLTLDKFLLTLTQCQSALLRYMEGRRMRCPWLYFLPLEDVLQLVCYNSNLSILTDILPKVILHSTGVIFNNNIPLSSIYSSHSSLPYITSLLGSEGEKLDLFEAVQCDGSVEGILNHLLHSVNETLHQQLTLCLTKYLLPSIPYTTILKKLPSLWTSTLSHQIIQVATSIILHMAIQDAIERQTKGEEALDSIQADLQSLMHTLCFICQGQVPADIETLLLSGPSNTTQLTGTGGIIGDSTTILRDSASHLLTEVNSEPHVESQHVVIGGEIKESSPYDYAPVIMPHQVLYQSIMLILLNYQLKLRELSESSSKESLSSSFKWQSSIQYTYDNTEQSCSLESVGVSLHYGFHYCGGRQSSALSLTLPSERMLVHLLRVMGQNYCGLVNTEQTDGFSTTITDVALSCGYPLFTTLCSSTISHDVMIDYFKGIAATGSWLYLHNFHLLPTPIIQATITLIDIIRQAKEKKSHTLKILEETLRLAKVETAFCIASTTEKAYPQLPASVHSMFKSYSLLDINLSMIIEAQLLMKGYTCANILAQLLAKYAQCEDISQLTIQAIIHRSTQHIITYYNNNDNNSDNVSSLLDNFHSNIAQHVIISSLQVVTSPHKSTRHGDAQRKVSKVANLTMVPEEDEERLETTLSSEGSAITVQQQIEPLCILIAAKEFQLTIPISLFQEYYPQIDVPAVLERLDKAQREMASESPWSREAVESAQESRAASVMQSDREKEIGSQYLEDLILRACLIDGLIPSLNLQQAVHSLVLLILDNRVTRLNGDLLNGRTVCFKTCVEVLKSMGYNVSISRLPVDAIEESKLLGDIKESSVLPQLLTKILSSKRSASSVNPLHLVILEGTPNNQLLHCLQQIANNEETLMHFPSKVSVPLDPSVKFLIMGPLNVVNLTSSSSYLPSLSLNESCSSWQSITQVAFLQLDKNTQDHLSILCQTHLPSLLELLAPVPQYDEFVDDRVIPSESQEAIISSQRVVLDKLQLISSMCHVLKCLLYDVSSSLAEHIENSFIYALIWTFGGALTGYNRPAFEKWIKTTFSKALPSIDNSIWHYKLCQFQFECCQDSSGGLCHPDFIYTARTAALSEFVKLLLSNGVHILVDGVCGSGKTTFLINTIKEYIHDSIIGTSPIYSMIHMYLNQESSPDTVWSQLQERIMWHSGTTYIPSGCEKLIALLDDLHQSQMDESTNGSVTALVNHHIGTGTIFAPQSYKEHCVGGVTYILTTDSTQTSLSSDLLNQVVYLHWEEYSSTEHVSIYSTLLKTHFVPEPDISSGSLSNDHVTLLVQAAVQVHFKLCSLFLDTEERKHYTFNGNILNTILKSLTLQLNSDVSLLDLLKCWLRESYWGYAARLTNAIDRERYHECVANTLKKYFNDSSLLSKLHVEATPSHEADELTMKEKLTNSQQELNITNPTPSLAMYGSTLKLAVRISHLLQAPHPFSSLLHIGTDQLESLLRLISSFNGFSVVRPSQVTFTGTQSSDVFNTNGPNLDQFKSALRSIYMTAGVKNDHVIVLLDDLELTSSKYFSSVYQFVKDCSITVQFTSEERSRVVNALRSEVTQTGSEYSEQIAWNFFLNRLKSNVRFILSFPDLSFTHQSGILKRKNLLSVVNICYQLPWDRKELLHVANYHLKGCSLPNGLQESTAHLLSSLHTILRDSIEFNSLSSCFNSNYEYFVERFCYELQEWQKMLFQESSQLQTAILTFSKAQDRHALWQEKLRREEIVLEEKGKSYYQLLVQVGQDTAIAKEQNKLVSKQTERIAHLQKVLPEYEHIYTLYMEDLKHIEHDTKTIALNLDQQSLLDLRSITKPPLELQELLEAVIIIIKSPLADLSWTKGAKRLMANVDRFREMLMEFSQHQEVSESLLEALQPYINRAGFNEDALGAMYLAAGQLCAWVKGVESYHRMLQDNIRRLDTRKSHVTTSLQEYSDKLSQLQHKVQVLGERLDVLRTSLEQASVERSQQSHVVNHMTKELKETDQFLQAISSLNINWCNRIKDCSSALINKIGHLGLSVAFITYLTSLEPQIASLIIRDYIKPCLKEKGFAVDRRISFQGLLGNVCPVQVPLTSQNAMTYVDVPEQQSTDLKQQESVDSTSGDSNPSQHSEDSELSQQSCHSEPNKPEIDTTSHEQDQSSPIMYSDQSRPDQYEELCFDIIHTLNSNKSLESLLLFPGVNIVQALFSELLEKCWNKWLLIYDPEFITRGLLTEKWVVIDGQECSQSFLQSIEQALVEGHQVLVENITLPFYSAIFPIIQAGLSWHKTDQRPLALEFCARRIHVNKSFKLIMTTPTLPTSQSTCHALSCHVHVINLGLSLSLTKELLLHEIQTSQHLIPAQGYTEIIMTLTQEYVKVDELNKQLVKCLSKVENGVVTRYIVDKIEHLMRNLHELQDTIKIHYQLFEKYHQLQDKLYHLCLFSSVVYKVLQSISKVTYNFYFTWKEYTDIFHQVLNEDEMIQSMSALGREGVENHDKTIIEIQFKKLLINIVLSRISRCLGQNHLNNLAICLYLLCQVTNFSLISSSQIDQLLFIAIGELQWDNMKEPISTELMELMSQLPTKPEYISQELFTKLYLLPIPSSLLETARLSMFTRPDEWQKLLEQTSLLQPSHLPWIKDEGEMETTREHYSLDDLVLLKALVPYAVSLYINTVVKDMLELVPLPVLSDVITTHEGTPILMLYNEKDMVSQGNLFSLQDTLSEHMNSEEESRSLITLSLGLQNETNVLTALKQSTSDCVLVKDIHLVSESGLKTLYIQLQGLLARGQCVMLTGECHEHLPIQLLSHCHLVSLSEVAPTQHFQQLSILSKLTNTTGSQHYLTTLLAVLSMLPQTLLKETLPQNIRPLIFLLSAFHSHLVHISSTPPQLHHLIYCISELHSLSTLSLSLIISTLHCTLNNLYTPSVTIESVHIIDLYIRSDLLEEDSVLSPFDDLVLPIPSSSVSPEFYCNHVIGIMESMDITSNIEELNSPSRKQELLTYLRSVFMLLYI